MFEVILYPKRDRVLAFLRLSREGAWSYDDRVYSPLNLFSDADFLVDSLGFIIGFYFIIDTENEILDSPFSICENVSHDNGSLRIQLANRDSNIETVQRIGATLYYADLNHYVIGIPIEVTDKIAFEFEVSK